MVALASTNEPDVHPIFFEDVSFHVSFYVKFGIMRCRDSSINNPKNSCLVTWKHGYLDF